MPTYAAICVKCTQTHDYVRRVADRNDVPVCCAQPTQRMLDNPQVGAMAWTGHAGFNMLDGTRIETGNDYKRYLAKNNLVPESEGSQEHRIRKHNTAQTQEREVKAAVVEAYRELSAKGLITG